MPPPLLTIAPSGHYGSRWADRRQLDVASGQQESRLYDNAHDSVGRTGASVSTELIAPTAGLGRRIQTNGIEIYYEAQGAGHTVLMLHGGIMDHQSWGNQIGPLSAHFRVLAPDTRAHGRSGDTDEPLSYAVFAEDWVALLRELNIEKASLVGFSDGGCTGLLLATKYPDLVDRLVLIGTPYNISNYRDGTIERFASMTPETLYGTIGPHFAEVVRKAEAQYPDSDSWQRFWKKLVNELWVREPRMTLDQLAAIRCPTLILHAENEGSYDLRNSKAMARTIPNSKLMIVPDTSHTSPQEQPEFVNRVIVEFLSGA
jgi:pimeloyl-ACP methyl ester carboxylesterase